MGEFDLIRRFFTRPARKARLGVGDDCALIDPVPGQAIAVSTDMLVAGVHFLADADPEALGHKALAVNLSDLAAMGASPRAFTLSIALPQADEQWLEAFARGMFALADRHDCELVGGDTTAGPLNICIAIFGDVPPAQALRRDAARAGDDIWVSGTLGDAALALAALQGRATLDASALAAIRARLERPEPRVALGLALRGIAHAAIDLSDGLVGDLGHVLEASRLGAEIELAALPLGPVLRARADTEQMAHALAGGDDYELCFTAPADRRARIEGAAAAAGVAVTRIGRTSSTPGLRCLDRAGNPARLDLKGYDHFR